MAIKSKLYNLKNYGTLTHKFYDFLIFNKIKVNYVKNKLYLIKLIY
jgi:hypothetical protein